MSAIDVHVGHRIAARRRAARWSVEALAARTDLPAPRLHAYEAGERRAVASDLLALSSVLDVPPSHFFEGFAPGDEAAPPPRHGADAWPGDWPKE